MTIPRGPPVYHGDEVGLTSDWATGGTDAALRPPLSPDSPELTDPSAAAVLELVRRLGQFRRSRPWLTSAALEGIRADGASLAYRVTGATGETISVYVNPSSETVTWPGASGDPAFSTTAERRGTTLELPAGEWTVLA
jgi:uncharacterized protein DUF3459